MHVKYLGNEDYRVLRNTDFPTGEADDVEWELVWDLKFDHVLEVEDEALAERILHIGFFRQAGPDEVEAATKKREAFAAAELARLEREARVAEEAGLLAVDESQSVEDESVDQPGESAGSPDDESLSDDRPDESDS